MPRLRADLSAQRLAELAEAGLQVFCRQGFERSQVADVAREMGVAVGTVYLYVEGKEALFDLVVRHASEPDAAWMADLEVPVKTPEPGSTLGYLKACFDAVSWPVLEAAMDAESVEDPVAELEGVLREQYGLIHRHRRGLLLLMRSALDFPGLAQIFVLGLRNKLLDSLCLYLERRIVGGVMAPVPNLRARSAVAIQAITWANLQRPQDPGLSDLTDEEIETATLGLVVRGLIPSQA
ncbi:AcrR family transcriptional regulator [Haloferula luteola]|uniref:AcrR family transcriptional regulator n=1 Tax=Haloferula luteola TaxID=595692 RepID=A0A840VFI5_9BACT|nr:TetR/AcrR family transcriptional regulator [Haloferula luteola]MBB5351561.1 AcrR family transcriptional regulator [Haloferula luteola]